MLRGSGFDLSTSLISEGQVAPHPIGMPKWTCTEADNGCQRAILATRHKWVLRQRYHRWAGKGNRDARGQLVQ